MAEIRKSIAQWLYPQAFEAEKTLIDIRTEGELAERVQSELQSLLSFEVADGLALETIEAKGYKRFELNKLEKNMVLVGSAASAVSSVANVVKDVRSSNELFRMVLPEGVTKEQVMNVRGGKGSAYTENGKIAGSVSYVSGDPKSIALGAVSELCSVAETAAFQYQMLKINQRMSGIAGQLEFVHQFLKDGVVTELHSVALFIQRFIEELPDIMVCDSLCRAYVTRIVENEQIVEKNIGLVGRQLEHLSRTEHETNKDFDATYEQYAFWSTCYSMAATLYARLRCLELIAARPQNLSRYERVKQDVECKTMCYEQQYKAIMSTLHDQIGSIKIKGNGILGKFSKGENAQSIREDIALKLRDLAQNTLKEDVAECYLMLDNIRCLQHGRQELLLDTEGGIYLPVAQLGRAEVALS